MHFRGLVLCFVVFALSISVGGQTKRSARRSTGSHLDIRWKLASISVKGSEHYANDEILNASGLQIGQSVNEDDFRKATELLGQTGLFTNVAYAYSYSSDGAKLEFQLSDNDQLVPAKFANFVWWSDQDLLSKLSERVPLFKGLLPLTGELADLVSNALQALLIEQKIRGVADYTQLASLDGPVTAILFTVGAHNIRIHGISFTGAGAKELPLLQNAAKRLLNTDYTHTVIENEDRLGFRPVYLQTGHLKASFQETGVKVVQESEDETTVDVTIQVTPGLQYKLASTSWTGNSTFPSEQLQDLIRLKVGEPADALELDKELHQVTVLYGTKGYMKAQVIAKPVMDDSSATVHYNLVVNEGDVYKMGELEVRGLDEKNRSKMVFDWKLLEGQVYDSSYFQRFVKESSKDLPQDVKWNVILHEALNDDQTVDVTLTYENKQ
jgi:outer membrane protein assembly factor BamA